MKKLNLTTKLAPVLTSGVLFLTGCGVIGEATNEFDPKASITIETDTTETNSTEEIIITTTESSKVTETTTEAIEETSKSSYTTTQDKVEETYVEEIITTPVVTETVTEVSKSTTTAKPGVSGTNEFNNHLQDPLGELNTYSYIDTLEEYELNPTDTLDTLAIKFNTTKSMLMEKNNLTSEDISGLKTIKYPVKDEYINAKKGTDIQGIAAVEGLDVEVIRELNNIPENATQISKDAAIRLHRFIGNEDSYETYLGTSNVIYNNKIMGEKVLTATGFAGASQQVVVLYTSPFEYGVNTVTQYSFDGAGTYTPKVLCLNAKDIELKDGMPVVYLRNDEDIIKITEKENITVDDSNILQWQSQNYTDYKLYEDENGCFFVMNGYQLDNNIPKEYIK